MKNKKYNYIYHSQISDKNVNETLVTYFSSYGNVWKNEINKPLIENIYEKFARVVIHFIRKIYGACAGGVRFWEGHVLEICFKLLKIIKSLNGKWAQVIYHVKRHNMIFLIIHHLLKLT